MSRVPSGEGALRCASGGISPAPGTARSPLPRGGLSPPGAPSGPPRLRSVLVPARRRLPAPSHPALLGVAQGRGSALALDELVAAGCGRCGRARGGPGRVRGCGLKPGSSLLRQSRCGRQGTVASRPAAAATGEVREAAGPGEAAAQVVCGGLCGEESCGYRRGL